MPIHKCNNVMNNVTGSPSLQPGFQRVPSLPAVDARMEGVRKSKLLFTFAIVLIIALLGYFGITLI